MSVSWGFIGISKFTLCLIRDLQSRKPCCFGRVLDIILAIDFDLSSPKTNLKTKTWFRLDFGTKPRHVRLSLKYVNPTDSFRHVVTWCEQLMEKCEQKRTHKEIELMDSKSSECSINDFATRPLLWLRHLCYMNSYAWPRKNVMHFVYSIEMSGPASLANMCWDYVQLSI